jgi:hypothetical protein
MTIPTTQKTMFTVSVGLDVQVLRVLPLPSSPLKVSQTIVLFGPLLLTGVPRR